MLIFISVSRSSGKNRNKYERRVFAYRSSPPDAPKLAERKQNEPMSRRLAKKRGLYDPVYIVDVPWTYKD